MDLNSLWSRHYKRVQTANHATEVVKPALVLEQAADDAEILHASIKAGTVAQIVVAAIAVIGLVYLLKLVLITILVSMLLAYVLEPLVSGLRALRIPRGVGALIAVLAALAFALGVSYFSYNRVVEFTDQLPNYSGKFAEIAGRIQTQAARIEDGTRSITEMPKSGKSPVPVKIQQPGTLSRL